MIDNYRIKSNEIYKISLLILFFIILGVFSGSLLDIDLTVDPPNIGVKEIFLNNVLIGIVLILLTNLVSYPIILFNSFFLGLNIYFGVNLLGAYKTFMLLIFHTPIEIIGWIICLTTSKRVLLAYKNIFKKKNNTKLFKHICKYTFILIMIYLIAAGIEYFVFDYFGGTE